MAQDTQRKNKAAAFAKYWENRGYEKGDSQTFWNMLLRDLFDITEPEQYIEYEDQVMMDASTGFIDGYMPKTKVLIEQKSKDKDLRKAIKQSDGSLLTPFQQAKKYIVDLPVDRHPKWVITCNFKEFNIYNMNNPKGEPEIILLKALPKEYYRLSFLVDAENVHLKKEMDMSFAAGEIVGQLYDAFAKQYPDMKDKHAIESLNKLCVRIVFCLYAEDAGLFKFKSQFHDYLNGYPAKFMRQALIDLFKVLDTEEDKRGNLFLTDDVLAFPYVNGGLFSDQNIMIPIITDEIRDLLLTKASDDFNWSEISPTIFGAVFESTLNPETRRAGGMHYTSIENIHKVIDPLFLDDLKTELEEIKSLKQQSTIEKRVAQYQNKLASLKFLDPAAGSGNFLTESYMALRKLENEALQLVYNGAMTMLNPVKVSISQFYGIEINDFAVSVAQTALWIAESQMKHATEDIFNINLTYLPLQSLANITEGNALTKDWNDVIPVKDVSFIMGNPPFVGMKYQTAAQKKDMAEVFKGFKNYGSLDYVASWYKKAAEYIQGTDAVVAFVSTNSITQGEQAPILWEPLINSFGVDIHFAYRTFRWDSEANSKAHVHCVIVGFGLTKIVYHRLFESDGTEKVVSHINCYLCDAPDVFINNRTKPLCNVPKVIAGNKPVDGDFLKINKEDYADFIKREPNAGRYIKKLVGGYEFINNVDRYVLWLVDASPEEIKTMPLVADRVKRVREARLAMIDEGARKLANTPTTFRDTLNPNSYIVIPIVSSESRRYIPMGFLDGNTIPTNQVQIVPDADLYEFGVLESNVHMAWTRAVCGRLKSDYRYTGKIVYNNFPWPESTEKQKETIKHCASKILEARAKYPKSSLADMYGDEMYLYPELLKAHQENDKAVMVAYGFDWRNMKESECVAELMKLYQQMTNTIQGGKD